MRSSAARRLRAALGFLQLPPRAPELRLLRRWLDTWMGRDLIVVGVERQRIRFSLSHIAEGECRQLYFRQFARLRTVRMAAASKAGGDP